MPKSNYKADDSHLFSKPYAKAENASKKKRPITTQHGGDSPQSGNKTQTIATTDPINCENVLKCYEEHQKVSVVSLTKQFKEVDQKVQNTNLIIAERNKENSQLKKLLQDSKKQGMELSAQCKKLLENNNKLEQQITENNKKYSSLESGYGEKQRHFKADIHSLQVELAAQQKQIEDLLGELKTVQDQHRESLAQFETIGQQKDNQLYDVQMKYAQLQAQLVEMEEKKLQFIEEKETAQSQQQAELSITVAKLDQSVQRESVLLSRVSELKDCEMRYLELQQLNQQISIEACSVTQRLEAEIERQKLQMEELFKQNQDLKTDEKRHQTENRALQAANDQLKDNSTLKDAAAQNELRKSASQLSQVRQQFEELQQKYLNITNTVSAEKDAMTQEFQEVKLQNEQKLAALQDELELRNADLVASQQQYAELKCNNNATIAELNYKISSIGKHFYQPVGIARVLSSHEADDSTMSQTAPLTISPEAPLNTANVDENSNDSIIRIAANIANQPRMPPVRQLNRNKWYVSDFITDSDDNEANSEPSQPKLNKRGLLRKGNGKAKRERSSARETSAFDKLMNS